MQSHDFSIDYVKDKLKGYKGSKEEDPRFRPSAVLVLLIPSPSDYSILITARSRNLNNHRGEMAFPGGKFDPELDKNHMETALRETYEEVGIRPEAVQIIGKLDDFPTISNFIIRPFVGVLSAPNPKLTLNPSEVEAVIQIPVGLLMYPGAFTEFNFPDTQSHLTVLSLMYTDPVSGKKFNVWGATAHLLSEYLRIVYGVKVRSGEYIRPTLDEIQQYRVLRKKKKASKKK